MNGMWIEIRYKNARGELKSHWVIVDSMGCFFWNPTETITEVYFRISSREMTDWCVIVRGRKLFVPLWTPDEFAKLQPIDLKGGILEGRVFQDADRRVPAVLEFQYLQPLPVEPLKLLEIEDPGLSPKLLENLRKKSGATPIP